MKFIVSFILLAASAAALPTGNKSSDLTSRSVCTCIYKEGSFPADASKSVPEATIGDDWCYKNGCGTTEQSPGPDGVVIRCGGCPDACPVVNDLAYVDPSRNVCV